VGEELEGEGAFSKYNNIMKYNFWRSFDFRFNRSSLLKPSVLALMAANLFPLAGVIFLGWDVFPLLVLFWMENLVIGAYTVIKMLLIPGSNAGWAAKFSLIPFFCLHYGIFTLVHGVFVFVMFGGILIGETPSAEAASTGQKILDYQLGWGALILLVSHGISLFRNYIGAGEYKTSNLNQVMSEPYGRVVVLHITIVLGGFLIMLLGSPLAGLILLIVLKTAIDLRAHLREHAKAPSQEPKSSPGIAT
jgi:hypothetical protein